MPLKKNIWTRIFGLAIFLLTLTIVLLCFLLWEVAEMEAGLQTLAHGDASYSLQNSEALCAGVFWPSRLEACRAGI